MSNQQFDELLKRMPKIAEVVNSFKSENIQERVFEVLLSSIHTSHQAPEKDKLENRNKKDKSPDSKNTNEIPGIAILEEDGSIRFTIRDIKAKSAIDAGLRLCLVAAFVNEKFNGQEELDRQSILKPLLDDWRVNNGNTRDAINKHRGIINTRSTVKLDSHAKKEAEKIINEILDDEYEGKWKPSDVGKSAKKTKKKVKNDN